MTIASGHFTVDMYSGMIPVLFPALMHHYGVSLGEVALVSLAYTGCSSVSQPLFGWIADRFGTRYIGFTQMWSALLFSTVGFAPNFVLLVLLAGLAGFGSGAFHPMGAMNASAVIKPGQGNMSMSVYVSGGTIGFALGPLIGAGLVYLFGLHGTIVMLIPGLAIGSWLIFAMKDVAVTGRPRRGGSRAHPAVAAVAIPVGLISIVVAMMMLRQVPVVGIESFLPAWYSDLGYSSGFYSSLATTMVLASAAGALGVGGFADRYGRRAVMIATIVLTIPVVWAFITFPGPWAFVFGAMIGFLASSTGPLLLLMAQQLMTGNAGMASGLILGLGFVSGGIATPILGSIADATSMTTALYCLLGIVILSIAVAWLLPSESTIRGITERQLQASSLASATERGEAAGVA
ncbi:MAG TPA: MFS transporter [Thermomicrobiales bacterium]|nr:MFS transporter [Thermomicrobiales bacterium]